MVNEHIQFTTKIMSLTRSIFRIWSPVFGFPSSASHERRKKAIKLFYSSKTVVSKDFVSSHPYLDVFPGQILNLKHSWNPSMQLHNNCKVVVVGIHFRDEHNTYEPLTPLSTAIANVLPCADTPSVTF